MSLFRIRKSSHTVDNSVAQGASTETLYIANQAGNHDVTSRICLTPRCPKRNQETRGWCICNICVVVVPCVRLNYYNPSALLLGDLDRTIVDALDDIVGVLPVDGASGRLSGSEDLLDGTGQVLGERLVLHLSGDLYAGHGSCRVSSQSPPYYHDHTGRGDVPRRSRRKKRFQCA